MILLLASLGFAGELPLVSASATGPNGQLELSIVDGDASLTVTNTSDQAFVIDWERSTITPNGSEQTALIPAGDEPPEPNMLVAPVELRSGASITVRPVPRSWLVDGPDNDEFQWSSWTAPGEIQITLAIQADGGEEQLVARWKQTSTAPVGAASTAVQPGVEQGDQPLAIPAQPVPASGPATSTPQPRPPMPGPVPASVLEDRIRWTRAYTSYRRQEKIARTLWITSASVGAVSLLLSLGSLADSQEAPDNPVGDEPSRADLEAAARAWAVVGGAGIGLALPTMAWDFSARKKRKALGPRP